MSDIYLQPRNDGGEITVTSGKPEMTGGLDNAVYLSLFTAGYWGNAISEQAERYGSIIPGIMAEGMLSNQTRLDVIEAAQSSLQWMIDEGIAERVEARAEIANRSTLYLAVTIYEPGRATPRQIAYGLNWDAQEVQIL